MYLLTQKRFASRITNILCKYLIADLTGLMENEEYQTTLVMVRLSLAAQIQALFNNKINKIETNILQASTLNFHCSGYSKKKQASCSCSHSSLSCALRFLGFCGCTSKRLATSSAESMYRNFSSVYDVHDPVCEGP